MKKYAVETINLSRQFHNIKAVDDLCLTIPYGIVFGFLGSNGSGKTTTIHMLLGLLKPSLGTAAVMGLDIRTHADQIRAQSGALLEHTGLYERLNAEENLEFFGRINHLQQTELQARIKDLLTHFGLWDRRTERVGSWSRGMKQKPAIARTLLHRPAMIFLDEPTAGLDPVAAAALRDDIAMLVEKEGVTVFLNTHNLAEAEKLCAQVGVIHNGKLLTVGNPTALGSRQGSRSFTVTGTGFSPEKLQQLSTLPSIETIERKNNHLEISLSKTAQPSSLAGFLVGAGIQIEEIHRSKADLEDVFLALVEENQNDG